MRLAVGARRARGGRERAAAIGRACRGSRRARRARAIDARGAGARVARASRSRRRTSVDAERERRLRRASAERDDAYDERATHARALSRCDARHDGPRDHPLGRRARAGADRRASRRRRLSRDRRRTSRSRSDVIRCARRRAATSSSATPCPGPGRRSSSARSARRTRSTAAMVRSPLASAVPGVAAGSLERRSRAAIPRDSPRPTVPRATSPQLLPARPQVRRLGLSGAERAHSRGKPARFSVDGPRPAFLAARPGPCMGTVPPSEWRRGDGSSASSDAMGQLGARSSAAVVVALDGDADASLARRRPPRREPSPVKARIVHELKVDATRPRQARERAVPHALRPHRHLHPDVLPPRDGTYDLIVHFHGLAAAQESNVERAHVNAVVASDQPRRRLGPVRERVQGAVVVPAPREGDRARRSRRAAARTARTSGGSRCRRGARGTAR